jgi:hypothetical protein
MSDEEVSLGSLFGRVRKIENEMNEIRQLLAMPAFEAGTVDGLRIRVDEITKAVGDGVTQIVDSQRRRIAAAEEKAELMRQEIEGQRVRIERGQGTVTDLLQRFEAWKTVGNELGQLVEAQGGQLQLHSKMLQTQGEIIQALKTMLEEIRDIILNKGPDDEPARRASEGRAVGHDDTGQDAGPGLLPDGPAKH